MNDIYNADETALYYQCLPQGTYILKTENNARGSKGSKKRVTVLLCTNANGTDKFNPMLIGNAENPRCFKNIQKDNLPVIYRSNKNAWMTAKLFEEFLELWIIM